MSSWLEQAEAMRGKAITPQRHNTYDSNIAELKKNVNEFLSEEAKETEHKDADDPEYDPSGRKYPPALQGKRKESSHDPSGYPYPKEKKTKDYTWPNEKATEAPGGEQGRPPSREGFDEEEETELEESMRGKKVPVIPSKDTDVKKCTNCGYNYTGSKCDNPGCEASGNVTAEVKARRERESEEEAEREKIRGIRSSMM